MRKFIDNPNVDNSDPTNYPGGRVKNDTGASDGTPVDERVYGDLHQLYMKLCRDYGIVPNNLPDNVENGYQLLAAFQSLASKNDYILPLTVTGGVLQVPIKIGLLKDGEQVVCKSGFNVAAETQIKGSDNTTLAFTKIGDFKTGEYVRMIKAGAAILLVRLVDLVNLDTAVSEFLYLKAATIEQEMDGTLDTVATTPLTNLLAFVERVNGDTSDDALAIPSVRNGLLSKEYAQIIADLGSSNVKNIGWVSGLDIEIGAIGTAYATSGDIASCTLTAKADNTSKYRVVLDNAQSATNYYVRAFVQGQSSNIFTDNSIGVFVFQPINSTTFDFTFREFVSQGQNLKIHFEVVNI